MSCSNYFAVFCVGALYYVPHFLPVANEMKSRGLSCAWYFYDKTDKFQSVIENLQLELIDVPPETNPAKVDYYIFGSRYHNLSLISSATALIFHGIGTKSCYYDRDLDLFSIRFVEGEYRRAELDRRSPCPSQRRPVVGFSKLDPAVNFDASDREDTLTSLGLDPSRKTVLYAPTYYPSSIDLMGKRFPDDCADLNVILKPHQFAYSKKYQKQYRLLESWARRQNVYLAKIEEFNILPFFAVADVMISDESSAIFEFAALGKPVIRNRYVKLRLSYRLMPWRLGAKMDTNIERYRDVAFDATSYKDTLALLQQVLNGHVPDRKNVSTFCEELLGRVDGQVSKRIVDYLLSHRSSFSSSNDQ